MAIKREDLLKFSKSVELAITLIEDDSSGGQDGTEVKILHLAAPVNAVGSIPTSEGHEMKVTGNKVHVAADNIEEMLKNLEEKDGQLLYKGPMHLDVSKPSGREVNGQFTITKPAKIWLTATKFSRGGNALRQKQGQSLNTLVSKMFAGGATYNLAAESVAPAGDGAAAQAEVVPNGSEKENKQKVK
jgi:hypothetical protein